MGWDEVGRGQVLATEGGGDQRSGKSLKQGRWSRKETPTRGGGGGGGGVGIGATRYKRGSKSDTYRPGKHVKMWREESTG